MAEPKNKFLSVEVKTSGSVASLRDLTRVGLEVERLPKALQEEGMTEQELNKFVRERLSKVPVQILSRIGALHLTGAPTLFLQTSLFETEARSFIYAVELELVQGVTLERETSSGSTLGAPTWRAQAVGVAKKGQLSTVRDEIGAIADVFARDFVGK